MSKKSKVLLEQDNNVTFIKKGKRKTPNGFNQFDLKEIHPLTENQGKVFQAYKNNKHIVCAGSAGSGKTFQILYLCLNDLLYSDNGYEKIVIYRSPRQVAQIGFTPGSDKEKIDVYKAGVEGICNELFGRGDAFAILEKKDVIEFTSTTFARSITHNNTLVIFEEAQSATFNELSMVATRIGENSRLFLTGDTKQNDMTKNEKSGFEDFIKIALDMESMDVVNFTIDDIVRSGFVKEFLITAEKFGL